MTNTFQKPCSAVRLFMAEVESAAKRLPQSEQERFLNTLLPEIHVRIKKPQSNIN